MKGSLIRLSMLVFGSFLLIFLRYTIMVTGAPSFQAVDNPAAFADSLLTRVSAEFHWSQKLIAILCTYYSNRCIWVAMIGHSPSGVESTVLPSLRCFRTTISTHWMRGCCCAHTGCVLTGLWAVSPSWPHSRTLGCCLFVSCGQRWWLW